MQQSTGTELKRVISLSGFAFNIINNVIGSAIFVLPAIVALQLGGYSVFAYLAGGLMVASIMLCYAETGSKVTGNGGSYAYVKAAFGEFPAYIINWLFLVAFGILGDGAVISVFADSIGVLFPVCNSFWPRALLFFVSITFMVAVNIIGARQVITMVKLITVIKLIPLIAIIIFGFANVHAKSFDFQHLPTFNTFSSTMLVLFFAFVGFETALNTSGEIKNPKRNISRGIIISGSFIVIFYLLVQFVTQGILGSDMEAVKNAPLAAVADKITGSVGGKIILVTAALSCFGNVFADVLNSPRLLFAGARDGMFPAFLGKVHPKFSTPFWAIIIYSLLIFVVATAGGFEKLAILATAAILLIYLAVVLATIKLRNKKTISTEKAFRMPFGMLFPAIAMVTICWLLAHLKMNEILATIIFISIVSAIYFVSNKRKVKLKPDEVIFSPDIIPDPVIE